MGRRCYGREKDGALVEGAPFYFLKGGTSSTPSPGCSMLMLAQVPDPGMSWPQAIALTVIFLGTLLTAVMGELARRRAAAAAEEAARVAADLVVAKAEALAKADRIAADLAVAKEVAAKSLAALQEHVALCTETAHNVQQIKATVTNAPPK